MERVIERILCRGDDGKDHTVIKSEVIADDGTLEHPGRTKVIGLTFTLNGKPVTPVDGTFEAFEIGGDDEIIRKIG